jgi:hypothetical protein
VATLVARNENAAMVAPMMGSGGVCVRRESGISRFCFGAFGRNLASVAVKIFFTLFYFIKNVCTFSAILKDNVAINFIILQLRIGPFPSLYCKDQLVDAV